MLHAHRSRWYGPRDGALFQDRVRCGPQRAVQVDDQEGEYQINSDGQVKGAAEEMVARRH